VINEKAKTDAPAIPAKGGDSLTLPREATEREKRPPSPEEVAERVYHLFCQELRRERERRGHW
jgi:hypothetical protein